MIASRIVTLLAAAALCMFPAAPAAAQAQVTSASLVGDWTGSLALDAGVHPLTFVFRMMDTTLSGVVYDNGDEFGRMDGLTLERDTVRFTLQGLAFVGAIKGKTIDGDLTMFNGNHRQLKITKRDDKAKPARDDTSGA
ncbi:MAG TPA: hypothetical protein VGQ30_06405 [Gemmatimonadaceae bacterium]|jgi:hypothetical protein|nr:hypothetical protein [Gemmatimonadaceae bacterium]